MIYLLKPYYINLGSRIVKAPKIYFTDIGFVSYLTGTRHRDSLMRGMQAGALFENFVVQELLKHYAHSGRKPPLFYYRTNNGLEVDLVIEEKPGQLKPCEIKLTQTPHSGMEQSIKRLKELNKKKNIKFTDGAIISMVSQSFPLSKTTRAYNLKDFLASL